MNEINIYASFNYRKLLKQTNIYFNKKYVWYNPKTIFAPQFGSYTVSIRKKNIRICYWCGNNDTNEKTKYLLINFLRNILKEEIICITLIGDCSIIKEIDSIKTKQIQWGTIR